MQVAQRIGRHRLPEVLHQLAVELADLGGRELGLKHDVRATAEIHGGRYERFFHGQGEVAVTANSRLVPQGLLQCASETDSDVFDRVVLVDMQITAGLYLYVDQGMPR